MPDCLRLQLVLQWYTPGGYLAVSTHCCSAPRQHPQHEHTTFNVLGSLQGNCAAEPTEQLNPPRRTETQCLISVPADFLEVPTEDAQVWISDLYVRVVGSSADEKTLVGVHGGAAYLTDMSFVGDETNSRAIDVKQSLKLYVASVLLPLPILLWALRGLFSQDECPLSFRTLQRICCGEFSGPTCIQ